MEVERPTIADLSNATHNHEDAADGGKLAFWREIDTGEGVYSAGQVFYPVPCVLNHRFPANLAGSEFFCRVAPADGDAVVTIVQAGVDVGTITFSQGQSIEDPGVVSCSAFSAVAGSGYAGRFGLRFPDPADSAFAGLYGAMIGTRY